MSRILPVLALLLSVAALAAALLRPGPAPEARSEQPRPKSNDEVAALERRVELLEETSEHLEQRVGELLRKPQAVLVTADGGSAVPPQLAAEVAQLRSEVRGMIAGEALNSEGGKAYLKDAVRGVQEELQQEERKQRAERFAANQTKRQAETAAQWKKFVTDARLDYAQEQALNKALEAEQKARQAMFDQLRDGTKTFADLRGEMRKTREETDTALKQSLTDDQFKQFTETRREIQRNDVGGGMFGGGGGRREREGNAAAP